MNQLPLPIVLASKSPRRHELLKQMGFHFTGELKETDECYPEGLTPSAISIYIAEQKAKAFGKVSDAVLITADTIVALEGMILGKPTDKAHAKSMLRLLSGNTHHVYTGVVVASAEHFNSFYDVTAVTCRTVTDAEIDFYIEKYKPFDKAGSYGIQDWWGLTVVQHINGSYTNVMGLPTEKLYEILSTLPLTSPFLDRNQKV